MVVLLQKSITNKIKKTNIKLKVNQIFSNKTKRIDKKNKTHKRHNNLYIKTI